MVMVRWMGRCAADRWAPCARATARSMEVAVASRCAAARNASASCRLSVPSAWRSSAAMRASILSSVIPAKLADRHDGAPTSVHSRASSQDTTSSSTWSRSGSLNTS
ncbi:hypothetical protein C1Y40_03760 [Mycobacterium talmoniae]|uniref:Uncharacterized protein n=1 Tax=Mycobacterium talmoniae TaxID=1858794 RepID=A0A2S8BHA8_9MYCO|nr:hypothetical protein C1Y40_03760 [Mycobacterium talmoniae]